MASSSKSGPTKGQHLDIILPSSPAQSLAPLEPDLSFLNAFLPPALSLDAFCEGYLGKKCLAFRSSQCKSGRERMDALKEAFLLGGDLKALLQNTPSEAIQVWRKDHKSGAISTLRTEDTAEALKHHKAGASLYFRAPGNEFESQFVPAVSDGLGLGRCGYFDSAQAEPMGEVETFLSKKGHLTGWHVDFQTNFTLQLSGKKRWTVKTGSGVPVSACRGVTPHFKTSVDVAEQQHKTHLSAEAGFKFKPDDLEEGCESVVLEAGDCFFFPPGAWHKVECLEDSLSVNISIVGLSYSDLMASAMRVLMRKTSVGRSLAGSHGYHGPASLSAPGSTAAALSIGVPLVSQLLPFHLLPPICLLSHRFSGVPQLGEEEEDEEDKEGEGEGEELMPWSEAKQASLCASPVKRMLGSSSVASLGDFLGSSLRVWLAEDGTPVVTLIPAAESSSAGEKETKGATKRGASAKAAKEEVQCVASGGKSKEAASSADKTVFHVNPLAVVFRASRVVDAVALSSGLGKPSSAQPAAVVGSKRPRDASSSDGKKQKHKAGGAGAKKKRKVEDANEEEDKEQAEEEEGGNDEHESGSYLPPAPSSSFVTFLVTVNDGEGEDGFSPVARSFLQVPPSLAKAMDWVAGMTVGHESRLREVGAGAGSGTGGHGVGALTAASLRDRILTGSAEAEALMRALRFVGVVAAAGEAQIEV